MSKRALKKYLAELGPTELSEQILDLYERFPAVKTYYDFVFNPKEDKLIQEAKGRIGEEYFPKRRKKAKARRSVAQKLIKHYSNLGMEPFLLADLMGYNLETALKYEKTRNCPAAFYTSMYKSCREWITFMVQEGVYPEFQERFIGYIRAVQVSNWPNSYDFAALEEQL
jgi:hypothetical protein